MPEVATGSLSATGNSSKRHRLRPDGREAVGPCLLLYFRDVGGGGLNANSFASALSSRSGTPGSGSLAPRPTPRAAGPAASQLSRGSLSFTSALVANSSHFLACELRNLPFVQRGPPLGPEAKRVARGALTQLVDNTRPPCLHSECSGDVTEILVVLGRLLGLGCA